MTVRELLLAGAERWPERDFVLFEDGAAWTRRRSLDEAMRAAAALEDAGVRPGDRVAIMMGNGADWLRAWWGIAMLGAVIVPLNPNFRGAILADLLARVRPDLLIVEDGTTAPERSGVDPATIRLAGPAILRGPRARPGAAPDVREEDVHAIIFTSGTTGPSKGSLTTNYHLCTQSLWQAEEAAMGPDDRLMGDLPLFHLACLGGFAMMMATGGSVALRARPSLSRYWPLARELGTTYGYMVGSMASLLWSAPPGPDDRDHRMRAMLASPLPHDPAAFCARFGLEGLMSGFGSTETSTALCQGLRRPPRAGSCGQVRDGFEARLVGADGHDVADGAPGELVVRSARRIAMSLGYVGDADGTAQAWRDGWFHTGDLVTRDADGYFYWKDRAKDSLRRRGENVSSFEVEREVASHPMVAEAACVGVPAGSGGDEEIKVYVVCAGARPDWRALLDHLTARMPYFMVPRFFEAVESLPKTPTGKVRKTELRGRPPGPDAWDRQAAGLDVDRHGRVVAFVPRAPAAA